MKSADINSSLYQIYNRAQNNPNTDVEALLWQLSAGDENFYDELCDEYQERYGLPDELTNKEGFIYLLKAQNFHGFIPGAWLKRVKMGKTIKMHRRVAELNSQQAPTEITVLRHISVFNMSEAEKAIHKRFYQHRIKRKVIELDNVTVKTSRLTEWFDIPIWQFWLVHLTYDKYSAKRESKGVWLTLQTFTAFFLALVLYTAITSVVNSEPPKHAPQQVHTPAHQSTPHQSQKPARKIYKKDAS